MEFGVILVDELGLTTKRFNLHHYTLVIIAYSNWIPLISVHTHQSYLLRSLFLDKQASCQYIQLPGSWYTSIIKRMVTGHHY